MRPLLAIVAVLSCLLPVAARAQAQPKRSREPLPALEVERSLVLQKGWFEVIAVYGHDRVRGAFDAGGAVSDGQAWSASHGLVAVRYGLTRTAELFAAVPAVSERRDGDASRAIGDARFGLRWELERREGPSGSTAVELGVAGSSGPDRTGFSDPISLTFSRGTPGAWLGAATRQQLGALAVGVEGRHAMWFAGETRTGRRNPDEVTQVAIDLRLQGGPLVVVVRPEQYWTTNLAGDAGLTGQATRLIAGGELHVSRGFELGLTGEWALAGRRTAPLVVYDRVPLATAGWTLVTRVRF